MRKEVQQLKEQFIAIENVFAEMGENPKDTNISVLGALAYYKLTDGDKFRHFVQWVKKNHINEAEKVSMNDIVNIYDKIYENRPKKVFLARWYPGDGEEKRKADARLMVISDVVKELGLGLEDMGTKEGGTFDIRSVMYNQICELYSFGPYETLDKIVAPLSSAEANAIVHFI